MVLVLVFLLILAFLSTGQSYPEFTEQDSCYEMCPPGYYKVGHCGSVGKHRCEKCGNGTFTEIKNFAPKCQRCGECGNYEVEIKPCSFTSNVECDCKSRYFYKIKPPTDGGPLKKDSGSCRQCNCKHKEYADYPDFERMCQPCTWCLGEPEWQRKCTTAASPFFINSSTAASTLASTPTRTTDTSSPVVDQLQPGIEMPWLILVVVLVSVLVLLCFLLLLAWNPFRYPERCLCWRVMKGLQLPVEDSKFNEQSRHQRSSPNKLTFTISEETPMMTLSPATAEHPAPISPPLPDTEHKASRQEEQPEHWPAIVLYAIIKEVPLRRWKEFLRLLSVADQQLERVELEAGQGLGSMEKQYQMLRLWSQRSTASMNDVFSALHYMDLSGCAQLLKESLEKL